MLSVKFNCNCRLNSKDIKSKYLKIDFLYNTKSLQKKKKLKIQKIINFIIKNNL